MSMLMFEVLKDGEWVCFVFSSCFGHTGSVGVQVWVSVILGL